MAIRFVNKKREAMYIFRAVSCEAITWEANDRESKKKNKKAG
jgi:hypothetical protein